MTADERLVTCVRIAMAVWPRTWRFRPPDSALDIFARAGPDFLLGIFLAAAAISRIDWAARDSSRRRIPASTPQTFWPHGLLVCAIAVVVFGQRAVAHGNLL